MIGLWDIVVAAVIMVSFSVSQIHCAAGPGGV